MRVVGVHGELYYMMGDNAEEFLFNRLFYLYVANGQYLIFSATSADMRRDVQEIFRVTPHHKQVMMFSATLSKDIRVTCKKFMANVRTVYLSAYMYVLTCCPQPLEIFVDDETKLTLHGLQQHYVKLEEVQKNRKLNELLDNLEFNQVRCTFGRGKWESYVFPGRHFREVRSACDRARQTTPVLQFPQYQHPFWTDSGRTV